MLLENIPKASWADEVELGNEELGPPKIHYDDSKNHKIITEFKINEEGQKLKVMSTYRIERRMASKTVAKRKEWKKFGDAANDPPGPNPANTIIAEEVMMQFVHTKEHMQENDQSDNDPLAKLKQGGQKLVTCRYCKGDHWSKQCPHKDRLEALQETLKADKKKDAPPQAGQAVQATQKAAGKYVPPSLREGGNRRGESMMSNRRDDTATIRVTNLSEDTRESDLQDLFRPFGTIQRVYLAKDKETQQSKGFAFISYQRQEDAAKAIAGVSGFGYDHLILNVEWAKPSGTSS